jgi:hypothetical protein
MSSSDTTQVSAHENHAIEACKRLVADYDNHFSSDNLFRTVQRKNHTIMARNFENTIALVGQWGLSAKLTMDPQRAIVNMHSEGLRENLMSMATTHGVDGLFEDEINDVYFKFRPRRLHDPVLIWIITDCLCSGSTAPEQSTILAQD